MDGAIHLHLTVTIESADLLVQLLNLTDDPIRIWRLGNSWGGSSWAVRLTTTAEPPRTYELRPTNQGYTGNVPRFIEIPPRGQSEVRLAPGGREWTAGEDIASLKDVALNVQVMLEIAPTEESTQQHVSVGRVESAPVVSQPPHPWLFGTGGQFHSH